MNSRSFGKTLLPTLLLSYAACGSVPIYVMRPTSWDGSLYDNDGKKAFELKACKPVTSGKDPCVVMFYEDAERIFEENADLKERLKKCEHP